MLYALIDYSEKQRLGKISSEEILGEVRVTTPKIRERNEKKITKKIIKTINQHKVENIVLSKKLFENKYLCKNLEDAKKNVITGSKIGKVLIMKIINELSKYTCYSKQKMNITLLMNEYSLENIDLIEYISKEIKELNVVSVNYTKYNKTALKLYEQYGYMINLYDECTDKDFKRSNIVINLDFNEKALRQIKTPKNGIIVSLNNKIVNMKHGFKGMLINDIEIYHEELKNNKNYRDLAICEAKIYKPLRMIRDNERLFSSEKFLINGYVGNEGKITVEEFEKIGRNFL